MGTICKEKAKGNSATNIQILVKYSPTCLPSTVCDTFLLGLQINIQNCIHFNNWHYKNGLIYSIYTVAGLLN